MPSLDFHANPTLAQRLMPARVVRIAGLLAQAIRKDRPAWVRRLLKCDPNMAMSAWVQLARGLDKHWAVDTTRAQEERRGMTVRSQRCWLTALETAMLMPDPNPDIIEQLLAAGARATPLVLEEAACHLARIVEGGLDAPRQGVARMDPVDRWQRAGLIIRALNTRGVEWDDAVVEWPPGHKRSARALINYATALAAHDTRWGGCR